MLTKVYDQLTGLPFLPVGPIFPLSPYKNLKTLQIYKTVLMKILLFSQLGQALQKQPRTFKVGSLFSL